ncbi:unnamed protein product [Cyclocybe aegerita]|uniref:FHA domain-containing protein n=1 Tax=Cyclocybe aegerita TaxID=1973307 RepID=A0A8S0XJJ1_CYCAE|nr:unnamed protein product [Cyclocybe aegerita]
MLLDDEIVFLGTRHPQTPPQVQRPVTGVVLHVEKCGLIDGHSLTFRRANSSIVHIGRRSGFEPDRRPQDTDNAMFRCAVVSRKHARITFSDSGHVYIIDERSHHGTHIRKSGELFSTMLKSETSTLLNDGDIITFGKAVGKGDECVGPVVVRVELLYSGNTQSTSTFRPLVVPSTASPTSDKSMSKPHSGRYGLDSSPSSSDESYQSGAYSDIEEIPPPPSNVKPTESQNTPSSNLATIGQAFNTFSLFKRLLPPAHEPTTPRRLPSVTEIVERPLAQMTSFFSSFGPDSVPTSPRRNSPGFASSMLSLADVPPSNFPDFLPVGFDASQHDIYEVSDGSGDKSRSNSPMDLASPSPPPEIIVPSSIPPLIEFPPLSPVLCVRHSPKVSNGNLSEDGEARAEVVVPETPLPQEQPAPPSPTSIHHEAADPVPVVTQSQMRTVEQTLKRIQDDLARLHNHRRKHRSRINSTLQLITDRFNQFDDRLAEVNAEYTSLFDQVDTIQHVDIPDLQGELEAIQERVDDIPSRLTTPEPMEKSPAPAPVLTEREDVKASVQALHSLVDEIKLLRKTTQQQATEELEAIKVLREAAMSDIATAQAEVKALALQAKQAQQAAAAAMQATKTPVLTSLKRKRDDTDENEEGSGASEKCVSAVEKESENSVVAAGLKGEDVEMDEGAAAPIPTAAFVPMDVDLVKTRVVVVDGPRPRKRARRFASIVAHTATAVTIGAVVTWSALAFS